MGTVQEPVAKSEIKKLMQGEGLVTLALKFSERDYLEITG